MQELLEEEISVLMNLDHPNIVKFYQCVYDNNYINIVMELVRGEPLGDYLIERGRLSEEDAQIIMYELVSAINYYQKNGVVHRDLKLENIIILNENGQIRIKIIDFGMSKLTRGKKKINLKTYCGTIDFIAPEILEGKQYDKSCDWWSAGVIAYILLSGLLPFKGQDDAFIANNIITCNYGFEEKIWENISKEAKDWIEKILELDPKQRISPEKQLNHHWLKMLKDDPNRKYYKFHPIVMYNLRGNVKPCSLHFELLPLFT